MEDGRFLIQEAYEIASQAHRFQFRKKSLLPYIVHPIRVASKVEKFDDAIITAVALCHDVFEDCKESDLAYYKLKLQHLNMEVYSIVDELTYKPTENFDKVAYLNSFTTKSPKAFIIKLFDRLDNVEDFASNEEGDYWQKYANKAKVLCDIWDRNSKKDNIDLFGSASSSILNDAVGTLKSYIKGNRPG